LIVLAVLDPVSVGKIHPPQDMITVFVTVWVGYIASWFSKMVYHAKHPNYRY